MGRFLTDKNLLRMSNNVVFSPLRNGSIFYFGHGAKAAENLSVSTYAHTRIDDLINSTGLGRLLFVELDRRKEQGKHTWPHVEEVWWNLSRRFAEASSGDVFCFGNSRDLTESGGASLFKSKFNYTRYVDEIFWKVELPTLENNNRVNQIFLNGIRL